MIVSVTISTIRKNVNYLPPFYAKFSEPRPDQVLPEGGGVDYRVLVRVGADIDIDDMLVLIAFGDYLLPVPELYRVLHREWSGGGSLELRALLVKRWEIGGQ